MAPIPNSSYGRLSFLFGGASLPTGAVCTIGVAVGTAPLQSYLSNVADFVVSFHELLSTTDCVLQAIELKRGPETNGPTAQFVTNAPGNQGASAAPPMVSTLIRKVIPTKSARFSGRMFWPSPPEGSITSSGVLDASALEQFQDAADGLLTGLGVADLVPVVFDGTSDPDVVEDLSVQARVASQRRRNRR